jgi:hypothetical protein
MELGLGEQGEAFGFGRASHVDHKTQHTARKPQPKLDRAGSRDFHWTPSVSRLQ